MPRTKKPKVHPDQEHLPGAEPAPRIASIINAAKRYIRDRDARVAANKVEKEAKDHLMSAMQREGLTNYEYGGIAVFIDTKNDVKVTSPTSEANGEADAAEE